MRILGIDPGSSATGFGVIEARGRSLSHVDHGVIRTPRAAPLAERLGAIHAELCELLERFEPALAVVELAFVAHNPRSALVLGQARGAVLAAVASSGVPVAEISAREVKKAVVGAGSADKSQVQAMVRRMLCLAAPPPTDAADALAIAICQANHGRLAGLTRPGSSRRRSMRGAHHLLQGGGGGR